MNRITDNTISYLAEQSVLDGTESVPTHVNIDIGYDVNLKRETS